MRLLVTRAAADAERTRRKLLAMGHEVIVSPVIETLGTGADWPMGVVDAVLATSSAAFEVGGRGPSPESRRLMPLYLVGSRTADAAKAHDFLGATTVAPTGAALSSRIGELAKQPRRSVYLAGKDRKADLEAAFESLGLLLDVVEIYEARAIGQLSPETVRAFRRDSVDAVLHYSSRSAELFLQATDAGGLGSLRSAHFCLSEEVAAPLREASCVAIHVAAAPTEADLLALVGQAKIGQANVGQATGGV